MKLHQISVPVSDLPRATGFYRRLLGAEPIATYDPPGLVFFDLNGTRLLLDRGPGPGAGVYLRVDDVAATVEELRAQGVPIVAEPHVIFPDDTGVFGPAGEDEWMAFFTDSEGNTIGLANRRPRG